MPDAGDTGDGEVVDVVASRVAVIDEALGGIELPIHRNEIDHPSLVVLADSSILTQHHRITEAEVEEPVVHALIECAGLVSHTEVVDRTTTTLTRNKLKPAGNTITVCRISLQLVIKFLGNIHNIALLLGEFVS